MAGRGPAPDPYRVRRGRPARGDWTAAPEGGWPGRKPPAPKGLLPATVRVWDSWFSAWWAANWTPDDLPQLRIVIRLYDRVARGVVRRLAELRQWMGEFGLTPRGRQDRRWSPPLAKGGNPLVDYLQRPRRSPDDSLEHARAPARHRARRPIRPAPRRWVGPRPRARQGAAAHCSAR